MSTQTRLLLPFTGGLNASALNYAIQMADQRQATLVPLALIPIPPDEGVRLEHIQQSHDFLELIRRKAERCGVDLEPVQVYTHDTARSIEAFACEMNCEAVLLFLCDSEEVLLRHLETRALLEHSVCNIHLLLLPEKRARRSGKSPVLLPIRWRLSGVSANPLAFEEGPATAALQHLLQF